MPAQVDARSRCRWRPGPTDSDPPALITGSLLIRSVFIALLGTQVALDAPLWSLALNMVVSSMLRGCFEPVAYALVADVVTDAQRIEAFGMQRMGTNLGWAIGPVLGGVLTRFVPYGVVFYFAAAAMIIAAIVTMRVRDPVAEVAGPGVRHRLGQVGDERDQPVTPGGIAPGLDDVDAEERHHERQAHRVDRAGEGHLPDSPVERGPRPPQ